LKFNGRNILINLSKLKKGGGQNVALNFLGALTIEQLNKLKFIVAKGSASHKYLTDINIAPFICPSNPVLCLIWEIFFSVYLRLCKPFDVIYSYFGFGMYLFSNTPQVSGSADSNLYYPELNFWEGENGLKRLLRYFVDQYRIYGLKNSTAIIFENEELMKKGVELYNLPAVKFITPSINIEPSFDMNRRMAARERGGLVKVLLLCGWQRNKGILKIPEIVSKAKSRGINIQVIFTAGHEENELSREFYSLVSTFGVYKNIRVTAPVDKCDLENLYDEVDVVMLLSRLESFSNNIIEAWAYGVPLIVADEPWSKSICNEAAIYVDREDANSVCDGIEDAVYLNRSEPIKKGLEELNHYPKIAEKVEVELTFLLELVDNV